MLEESTLEALYRDLRSRSQDEDAIQRVIVRVWQRDPPPDNPIAYARQALWNERRVGFRQARGLTFLHFNEGVGGSANRGKNRKVIGEAHLSSVMRDAVTSPPSQLRRVLARETLEGLDPRLVWDAVGAQPLTAIQRFRVWRTPSVRARGES
jgi:DNA-directed RNA polymerase specialized sigma24 family protein